MILGSKACSEFVSAISSASAPACALFAADERLGDLRRGEPRSTAPVAMALWGMPS